MSRSLKFRKKDYLWIKEEFPDFYSLLKPTAHTVGDEVYIDLANQAAYDVIFYATGDVLGDALNDEGELNADGQRFEEAWDYADREGKPIGEAEKLL